MQRLSLNLEAVVQELKSTELAVHLVAAIVTNGKNTETDSGHPMRIQAYRPIIIELKVDGKLMLTHKHRYP